MQYGMPTLIENKTLAENISLCKELGLDFIELNMNFPEYQIDKLEKVTDFYKAADDAEIYYKVGDVIPEVKSSLDRSGHVIVIADTVKDAIDRAESMIKEVKMITA